MPSRHRCLGRQPRDVGSRQYDATMVGRHGAARDAEQRALSGPVRSYDAECLALRQREIDLLCHHYCAEALGDFFEGKDGSHRAVKRQVLRDEYGGRFRIVDQWEVHNQRRKTQRCFEMPRDRRFPCWIDREIEHLRGRIDESERRIGLAARESAAKRFGSAAGFTAQGRSLAFSAASNSFGTHCKISAELGFRTVDQGICIGRIAKRNPPCLTSGGLGLRGLLTRAANPP